MKTDKATIAVRNKSGRLDVYPIAIEQFDAPREAIEALGEEETLRLINYAYSLVQRQAKRSKIVG